MARAVRVGAWLIAGVLAVWAAGAGAVAFIIAMQPRDIDGPIPSSQRVLWGGVGVSLAVTGLVLFMVAAWHVYRTLRPIAR